MVSAILSAALTLIMIEEGLRGYASEKNQKKLDQAISNYESLYRKYADTMEAKRTNLQQEFAKAGIDYNHVQNILQGSARGGSGANAFDRSQRNYRTMQNNLNKEIASIDTNLSNTRDDVDKLIALEKGKEAKASSELAGGDYIPTIPVNLTNIKAEGANK